MSNLFQLRRAAREIFDETIRAVDAGTAVRNAVHLNGLQLTVSDSSFELSETEPVYSIGIGKASIATARALESVLGDRLRAGVISAPKSNSTSQLLSDRWKYFAGGHPVPNEASLAAAKAALDLLDRANSERAFVIFLISGGGSAMMELPINRQIQLEDLQLANRILVNSGASIAEINAVRRTFSAIKAGRLAERAPNCDQVTLIISDVPAYCERYVASGPSLPPDAPHVANIIKRFKLRDQLPASIMNVVAKYEPAAEATKAKGAHFVLLDNSSALNAACVQALDRGFAVEPAQNVADQAIDAGCRKLIDRLKVSRSDGQFSNRDLCIVSGGEFSCPVQGDGVGGRNLETALRLALEAEKDRDGTGEFVALCAGTDGIDGNSPAAGAIVDSTTIERARRVGLDPNDFLDRSDAYSFFVALGDVITTGPTGTNVRDLRILLASGQ